MSERLQDEALDYHRQAPAEKLAVVATKPLATQRDPSLAYSPGVPRRTSESRPIRSRQPAPPAAATWRRR